MKITVSLNEQSIQAAINRLETEKEQLQNQMLTELLEWCCDYIIQKAGENISATDIGSNVKAEIQSTSNWEKIIQGNKATLTHKYDKAAYIEFGVGIVGQSSAHEKAGELGWQYDVDSKYKRKDRSWIFKATNDEDIDISAKHIDKRTENSVSTKGSPATMFLHNAFLDLITSPELNAEWNKIKQKYWG